MKEKITTLYSRNHISITKTTDGDFGEPGIERKENEKMYNSGTAKKDYLYYRRLRKPEFQRKVSPLGFYYEKKIYPERDHEWQETRTKRCIKVWEKYTKYEIVYFIDYGDTKIGHETRPWDLFPEDEGIKDHLIEALHKELLDIKVFMEDNKISDPKGIFDLMMQDIFGNKNGYQQMTDKDKILSHGFDLKTSFRK